MSEMGHFKITRQVRKLRQHTLFFFFLGQRAPACRHKNLKQKEEKDGRMTDLGLD